MPSVNVVWYVWTQFLLGYMRIERHIAAALVMHTPRHYIENVVEFDTFSKSSAYLERTSKLLWPFIMCESTKRSIVRVSFNFNPLHLWYPPTSSWDATITNTNISPNCFGKQEKLVSKLVLSQAETSARHYQHTLRHWWNRQDINFNKVRDVFWVLLGV